MYMSRKTYIILSCFAILAFFLRTYLFPDNLFFGPEQGNDFKIIRDIVVSHKYTLIGPKTDIAGVFHGPIYYYLATIPFAFSHGDPYVVATFFAFIQSLSVFLIYLLTVELTGKRRIGYMSALIFTVSYGAISYSRWLSGQPLTIPLSAAFFLFLLKFLKGEKWYLIGVAISFAFMGQAEFINYALVAMTGCVLIIRFYKKVISQPMLFLFVSFCAALFFSIGNFVLFDLRHEFLISKSVLGLISGTKGYYNTFSQSLITTYSTFISSSMDILGLPNVFITTLFLIGICIVLLLQLKKQQYMFVLFSWIIIPNIVLLLLRHGVLEQLYVFLVVGEIIGISIAIDYLGEKFCPAIASFFLFLICYANIFLWMTALPSNFRIFFQSTQPQLRYKDQLSVVDYVYSKAGDRPFYFQSYTIPYFWQDAWEYLFWMRGLKNNIILDEKKDELLYVIIQKDRSNPRFQYDWYKNTASKWGTLQDSIMFGELTVEERWQEDKHGK